MCFAFSPELCVQPSHAFMLPGRWYALFCAPRVKQGCAQRIPRVSLLLPLYASSLRFSGMLDLTKNSPDGSVGRDRFLPPKRSGFVLRWSQGKKILWGKKAKLSIRNYCFQMISLTVLLLWAQADFGLCWLGTCYF